MSRTPTALLTDQSVGATAAAVSNSTKTAFGASTSLFSLYAKLTNGNGVVNPQNTVRVYAAVSQFSLTTAEAPLQLGKLAVVLEIKPNLLSGGVTQEKIELQAADGAYLYTWTMEPKLDAAATLSLTLVEM